MALVKIAFMLIVIGAVVAITLPMLAGFLIARMCGANVRAPRMRIRL